MERGDAWEVQVQYTASRKSLSILTAISVGRIEHIWTWNRSGGNVLLEFPFTIIKRAYIPRFEPAGDTVEVERMLLIAGFRLGVCAWKGRGGRRTLQIPHAALHSSEVADTWLA